MAKKRRSWHADYDDLFIKPKRQRAIRHPRLLLAVVVGLCLSPLAFRAKPEVARLTQHPTTRENPYHDLYILKQKGFKRTAKVDLTRSLVATFAKQRVAFSNGFALTTTLAITPTDREHVVQPSTETNAGSHIAASLDGHYQQRYVASDLVLHGNLLSGLDLYYQGSARPVVALFATENVGTARSGYVFFVPNAAEHDVDYTKVYRYLLFADGSGVLLKSLGDRTKKTAALTADSSFAAFQKAFGTDYASLASDYHFVAPQTNNPQ